MNKKIDMLLFSLSLGIIFFGVGFILGLVEGGVTGGLIFGSILFLFIIVVGIILEIKYRG